MADARSLRIIAPGSSANVLDEKGQVVRIGIPATPIDEDVLRNPFQFPHGGKTRNVSIYNQLLNATTPRTLLNVAAGASNRGVVRKINIIFSYTQSTDAASAVNNLWLNIRYDGETDPSVSIPIKALIMREFTTAIETDPYHSHFIDVTRMPVDNDVRCSIVLRYPIPYTDGIQISLSVTNSRIFQVWTNVEYQDELPTCWNENLRMFMDRNAGTAPGGSDGAGTMAQSGVIVTGNASTNFTQDLVGKYMMETTFYFKDEYIVSVEDSHHLTVAACDAITHVAGRSYFIGSYYEFLNRPAGEAGWIASIYVGSNAGVEGLLRLKIDQEEDFALRWSGTEDFLESCFGGALLQGPHTGIGDSVADSELSGYRHFHDSPIRYADGIVGLEPNGSVEEANFAFTTVYYREI